MHEKYAIHDFTYHGRELDDDEDAESIDDDEDGDFAVYDTEKSTIRYFVVATCEKYWMAKMVRDALNRTAEPQE